MQLTDRVALVTGSSTGIGEAIARRFAAEGAAVLVHGLEREAGEAVAASIREGGGSARYRYADLESPDACEELVQAAVDEFGRLDILVNNAATTARSSLDTTDADTFDRIMAVNLRAPLLLCRAAFPHFRKAGGGSVLNIGSLNGYCGERNLLAYSVSKGGLVTLSRNLADAHGAENIRVNHFNLGWVLSQNEYALKQREGLPPDWPTKLPRSLAPSGRLLSPEEIAHFALAFVADGARLVNGSVIDLEQYPVIGRNPPKATTQ